ncbi:MAG: nitroreductase family deazaflavin-dependent oxidoreductase, partial [Acidimicrobiaceae bacterium]|nr:nitroreductase family deazaflavin-dependent oxidoreductase [Acidimicrobiaceae bacterium]
GSLRRSPLIRIRDGERYLLVASMGGAPSNPSWYLNLVENPEVTIQDRAETHRLRARTATVEEKAELWPLAVSQWPDYDDYQARTTRDLPLVICE